MCSRRNPCPCPDDTELVKGLQGPCAGTVAKAPPLAQALHAALRGGKGVGRSGLRRQPSDGTGSDRKQTGRLEQGSWPPSEKHAGATAIRPQPRPRSRRRRGGRGASAESSDLEKAAYPGTPHSPRKPCDGPVTVTTWSAHCNCWGHEAYDRVL